MTSKCKQAREYIDSILKEYLNNKTNENYKKYCIATLNFKERFHKRYDPYCLVDDYLFYNDFKWVQDLLIKDKEKNESDIS